MAEILMSDKFRATYFKIFCFLLLAIRGLTMISTDYSSDKVNPKHSITRRLTKISADFFSTDEVTHNTWNTYVSFLEDEEGITTSTLTNNVLPFIVERLKTNKFNEPVNEKSNIWASILLYKIIHNKSTRQFRWCAGTCQRILLVTSWPSDLLFSFSPDLEQSWHYDCLTAVSRTGADQNPWVNYFDLTGPKCEIRDETSDLKVFRKKLG